MRRVAQVGCDALFRGGGGAPSPPPPQLKRSSSPGWTAYRDGLLGRRGGAVSFRRRRCRVRVAHDCIVDRAAAAADAADAPGAAGDGAAAAALVVPSNQHMCGNANHTAWWFSGRRNVDGKVREACGEELREEIRRMKAAWKETTAAAAGATTFLPPGKVRTTSAPHLDGVAHLLHVVGPSTAATSATASRQLETTYRRCLEMAAGDLNMKTLFVPALCTGVFRMPFATSAEAAVRAVDGFLSDEEEGDGCGLREINFVLLEGTGAADFADVFHDAWST